MSVSVCLDAVIPAKSGPVKSTREAWLDPDYLLSLVNTCARMRGGGVPSFAWVTSFDPLGGESMGEFSEQELEELMSKEPSAKDCAKPQDAQKALEWLKAAIKQDTLPHKKEVIDAMGFKNERAYKKAEPEILDQIDQWLDLCRFATSKGALVVVRFEG